MKKEIIHIYSLTERETGGHFKIPEKWYYKFVLWVFDKFNMHQYYVPKIVQYHTVRIDVGLLSEKIEEHLSNFFEYYGCDPEVLVMGIGQKRELMSQLGPYDCHLLQANSFHGIEILTVPWIDGFFSLPKSIKHYIG